jgi:hypothetical protein
MLLSAALTIALSSAAAANPCDMATKEEAERVLGRASVPVPSDQLGEETAPSCIWATANRANEVKISVWSDAELPVVGMKDAAAYFAKMKADDKGAKVVAGLGDAAFATFDGKKSASGLIAVLKGERLITFEFGRVSETEARALVAAVMGRI